MARWIAHKVHKGSDLLHRSGTFRQASRAINAYFNFNDFPLVWCVLFLLQSPCIPKVAILLYISINRYFGAPSCSLRAICKFSKAQIFAALLLPAMSNLQGRSWLMMSPTIMFSVLGDSLLRPPDKPDAGESMLVWGTDYAWPVRVLARLRQG